MNSNDASNEEIVDGFELDGANSSVDDFIKELEQKEKSLDISSDLVIEIGDSEVEHDNIHDSFLLNNTTELKPLVSDSSSISEIDKSNSIGYVNLEEVETLKSENDELKESIKRQRRDFDNYRKRVERERSETFKNILSSLATQMLPVLDNLNRALDSTDGANSENREKDFQTFTEGIVLVNQQLNEVLMEMGVQPILSVGEQFNPEFHEAVASEETDQYPHQTVIQELLRGYRIDNRIIRASMVKVSSSPNSQPTNSIKID